MTTSNNLVVIFKYMCMFSVQQTDVLYLLSSLNIDVANSKDPAGLVSIQDRIISHKSKSPFFCEFLGFHVIKGFKIIVLFDIINPGILILLTPGIGI